MNLITDRRHDQIQSNVIIDTGGSNLYFVRNVARADHGYIEASIISRKNLLSQLSGMTKYKLNWPYKETSNPRTSTYDYTTVPLPNDISQQSKDGIQEVFYLMEFIDFELFLEMGKYEDIGQLLSKLSKKDKTIEQVWIDWVMRNKPLYDDKMPFGKYKGCRLYEIDDINYLKWVSSNVDFKDESLLYKIEDLLSFDRKHLSTIYRLYSHAKYGLGFFIWMHRQMIKDNTWLPPEIRHSSRYDKMKEPHVDSSIDGLLNYLKDNDYVSINEDT